MAKRITDEDRIIAYFKTATPEQVAVMVGKIDIIRDMRTDVASPVKKERVRRNKTPHPETTV